MSSVIAHKLPIPFHEETGLSADAYVLLCDLSDRALHPDFARTDAVIARATGIEKRRIVDLADELINDGYGVVASCAPPMGRFLTDDPKLLRDYAARLDHRWRRIYDRCRAVKKLADRIDAGRVPNDSTGQGRLFAG